MIAKTAWEKALKKGKIVIGDHDFALVGWHSPYNNTKYGPYFITVTGTRTIEVDRYGRFKATYPYNADHYFPWINEEVALKRKFK